MSTWPRVTRTLANQSEASDKADTAKPASSVPRSGSSASSALSSSWGRSSTADDGPPTPATLPPITEMTLEELLAHPDASLSLLSFSRAILSDHLIHFLLVVHPFCKHGDQSATCIPPEALLKIYKTWLRPHSLQHVPGKATHASMPGPRCKVSVLTLILIPTVLAAVVLAVRNYCHPQRGRRLLSPLVLNPIAEERRSDSENAADAQPVDPATTVSALLTIAYREVAGVVEREILPQFREVMQLRLLRGDNGTDEQSGSVVE